MMNHHTVDAISIRLDQFDPPKTARVYRQIGAFFPKPSVPASTESCRFPAVRVVYRQGWVVESGASFHVAGSASS
jgi:hypothetical protein